MIGRRLGLVIAGALFAITACASSPADQGDDDRAVAIPGVEQADGAGASPGAPAAASTVATTTTTTANTAPPATTTPATTTTTPTTSTTTTSTTTPSTTTSTSTTTSSTTSSTTSTTVPELDVYDPACVVRIQPGDSLGLIAERFDDPTVTASSLQAENDIGDADVINAGSLLDVCVDNGLDDVSGAERVEESAEDAARRAVVEAQQTKLNELFAGYGIRELLVDGISGPVTRQRLCAARVALGIPVNRSNMEAGSLEELALMAADTLPPPASSALQHDRWALVDRTCQIMFVGAGHESIAFVFSTSTGEQGHETRDQDRSRAFRYDPALQNGGWHNSTTFPVAIDNPLNGNMYRPIYFDGGQAIHGSNNVPTTPQSKGCMRLRLADQDALVAWLDLDGLGAPTWSENQINLRVNVQGAYVPG